MADPVADTTNSFATLEEANTYFANQYNRYALWAVITDADKSRLLIEATVMMTWGLSWNITIDEDDYSESYDVQKWACCEQAWAIYVGDRQSAPDTKGISEIKVDVSGLELNTHISVSDIVVGEGVEILTSVKEVVAIVKALKEEVVEEDTDANAPAEVISEANSADEGATE